MKRLFVFRQSLVFFLTVGFFTVFILLPSFSNGQVQIIRTLSNWDAHNMMPDSNAVDNFELEFKGPINSSHVKDIYHGPNSWGLPVRICDYPDRKGFEITWFDRVHPIDFCETKHFGVNLKQYVANIGDDLPKIDIQAWWTRIKKEAICFPVPSMYSEDMSKEINLYLFCPCDWRTGKLACYVDTIRYVYVDKPFPLEKVKWDLKNEWHYLLTKPVRTDDFKDLTIKGTKRPGALILQYALADTNDKDNPYAYVNWQFQIDTTEYGELIMTRFDINFDLHNITKEPKDNLEFDWLGYLRVEDIKAYYDGPGAWGNPPRIQEFDYGSLPTVPSDFPMETSGIQEGGLELTWMDKCNPIEPCHWAHFGFSTGIGVYPGTIPEGGCYPMIMLYNVQLSWTTIEKVALVPIPWQWWQINPDVSMARDIVQLANSYKDEARIKREYAVIPEPLPLDSLHFMPNIPSRWNLIDDKPKKLSPGDTAIVDIDLRGKMYGAVLIRYNVYSPKNENEPVVRVINQAEFYDPSPKTGIQLNTSKIPNTYVLEQNYPNPFNMETNIKVGVPQHTPLSVVVYNMLGQKMKTIHNHTVPAGSHVFTWDGTNDSGDIMTTGLYFCVVKGKGFTKTVKMLLTK